MEVLLKKTKITKGTLKQSLPANLDVFKNLNNFDVLGWCILDDKKITLIYNRITNQVLTYRYIPFFGKKYQYLVRKSVQRQDPNGGWIFPEVLHLIIEIPEINSHIEFQQTETQNDADMEKLLEQALDFAKRIAQGGQIYI